MTNLIKFKEQNLTQEELAEMPGLSVRINQRIEPGTRPKGYTLKVLAKVPEINEEDRGRLHYHFRSRSNRRNFHLSK